MKAVLLFLSLFSYSVYGAGPHALDPANNETPRPAGDAKGPACQLVPYHGQQPHLSGSLSPFWGQEVIGMPFVKDTMDRAKAAGQAPYSTRIGIIDGNFHPNGFEGPVTEEVAKALRDTPFPKMANSYHGTAVANLINGGAPFGYPGEAGKLAALAANAWDSRIAVAKMLKGNVDVVNISQSWDRRNGVGGMEELTRRAIVIRSAGNSGPFETSYYPGETTAKTVATNIGIGAAGAMNLAAAVGSTTPNIIMVGNMSSNGLMTFSSQPGRSVTIVAPSDYLLKVKDGEGYRNFGGTSGATPLVTGSAAMVRTLLGGELSTDEMRILLEKTAVPIHGSQAVPRQDGAGMLNAYKLAEVAVRLRARGWPANRASLIHDPSLYDFTKTAPAERSLNVSSLLDSGKALIARNECTDKQKGLALVQRAFLLSAGTPGAESRALFEQSRALLAATFTAHGLTGNAAFYQSLHPDGILSVIEKSVEGEVKSLRQLEGVVRALQSLPKEKANQIFSKLLLGANVPAAKNATFVAANQSPPPTAILEKALTANPNVPARAGVVQMLQFLGPRGLSLVQIASRDPSPVVRIAAIQAIGGILHRGGSVETSERILTRLAADPDPDVRAAVRALVDEVNREEG